MSISEIIGERFRLQRMAERGEITIGEYMECLRRTWDEMTDAERAEEDRLLSDE